MLIHGTAALQLPSEVAGAASVALMTDEFGSAAIRQESTLWAEQGKYFKACNPTFGTGIAMGIQTAFSDTANVLLLMRNSSTTKKIIPHYIRLINTVAGATTTSSHIGIITDTANRYSAGGTDLLTSIVNSSSSVSNASVVDVLRFGAVTATAISAKRQIARAMVKTQAAPCYIVGDEIKIIFSTDADQGLLSGAASARFVINVGPCVLEGQNHCMLVHMWNPANATTAPSWELEMAWWER